MVTRAQRIWFLVSMMAVSLLSGMVGGLFGQSAYRDQLNSLSPATLSERITVRREKELSPAEILGEVAPSMLSVYRVDGKNKKTGKESSLELLVSDSARSGYALAATADGWLIIPSESLDPKLENIVIVDHLGLSYIPQKRIDDTAINLSYVKISAQNLKPFSFSSEISLEFPLNGYLLEDPSTITSYIVNSPGYVATKSPKEMLQTVSMLSKVYNYQESFTERGQIVVSAKKEVIGVTSSRGIIPLWPARDALDGVLRSGTVTRPTLPLSYLDNAWLPLPPLDEKKNPLRYGATVVTDKPVVLKGPKGAISLGSGDVIASVNDERIEKVRSLSEIIHQYKKGDVVMMKVNQRGVTQTSQITL